MGERSRSGRLLPWGALLVGGLLALGGAHAALAEGPTLRPVVRLSPHGPVITGPPLAPGEARYHPAAIHNDGTVPFRALLSVLAEGRLAPHVRVEARAVEGRCGPVGFARSREVLTGPGTLARIEPQHARRLGAGESLTVCLRVALPSTVGDHLQGARAEARLQVLAE